jgi:hypothetical protein
MCVQPGMYSYYAMVVYSRLLNYEPIQLFSSGNKMTHQLPRCLLNAIKLSFTGFQTELELKETIS